MELTYGSFQNIFVINNAATQTPIEIIWIVMLTIGVCVAAYLITKSSETDADRNQTTSYKPGLFTQAQGKQNKEYWAFWSFIFHQIRNLNSCSPEKDWFE